MIVTIRKLMLTIVTHYRNVSSVSFQERTV